MNENDAIEQAYCNGQKDGYNTGRRYVDAMLRHIMEFVRDPWSVDKESGIAHYKHSACNMAFISEMMQEPVEGLPRGA